MIQRPREIEDAKRYRKNVREILQAYQAGVVEALEDVMIVLARLSQNNQTVSRQRHCLSSKLMFLFLIFFGKR